MRTGRKRHERRLVDYMIPVDARPAMTGTVKTPSRRRPRPLYSVLVRVNPESPALDHRFRLRCQSAFRSRPIAAAPGLSRSAMTSNSQTARPNGLTWRRTGTRLSRRPLGIISPRRGYYSNDRQDQWSRPKGCEVVAAPTPAADNHFVRAVSNLKGSGEKEASAVLEVKSVERLAGTPVPYAYAVKAGPWIFLTGHEAYDWETGNAELWPDRRGSLSTATRAAAAKAISSSSG